MQRLPGEVRWSITESDRPKGRDLAALEAREAELRRHGPAEPDTVNAMIARLFLRFPNMAKATPEQVRSYALDIMPFPLWAITKGISSIIAGEVLKAPEFPPSSLQVREAVAKAFKPVQEEAGEIRALLEANVVPDSAVVPSVDRRRELAAKARELMGVTADIAANPYKRANLPSRFDDAKTSKPLGPLPPLSDHARTAAGYAPRQPEREAAE